MGRRHLLRSGYLTNELGMGGLGVDAYKVAWSSTEGWTKEILKLRNWRRWTSEGKRRSSGSRICLLSMGSSVCHLSGFLSVELQVSFLASQSIWKLMMCRISGSIRLGFSYLPGYQPPLFLKPEPSAFFSADLTFMEARICVLSVGKLCSLLFLSGKNDSCD